MNFNDFSVHEFCRCVYGIGDKCSNQISGLEMYSFIKSKTNNFDLTLFDFLRNDVRSFFDYIEVDVEDPQKHLDLIDDKFTLSSTDSLTASQQPYESFTMSRNNVPEQVKVYEVLYDHIEEKERSLREKIELLSVLYDFIIGFKNNIGGILEFSDLVEKEYQKAIESEKLNQLPVGSKVILNELSSRDFIEHCLEQDVPELEIYEYLKLKTDNFESNKVSIFRKELFRFIHKVKISVTEEWVDANKTYSEEHRYSLFCYLDNFTAKNSDKAGAKEIIDEMKAANAKNDLRLAFSMAQRIDPTVRKTVSYYSFDCILRVVEENNKVKDIVNSTNSNTFKTPKLSLSEMALIYIYRKIHVNNENAVELLAHFNVDYQPSGLIKEYNYYSIKSNRVSSGGPVENSHHKKRLNKVIKFLEDNNLSSVEAQKDLDLFEKNIDFDK